MQMNPYLMFNGQCEAAFKFYEKCLGGKIIAMLTYGDTPAAGQVPAASKNKIAHARMTISDQVLMGSDAPPNESEAAKGFKINLNVDTPAEAERLFHALVEGGKVQMPLEKTFWALKFGMLTDKFGVPWMINCEQAA
jgi:PhnB protein